MWISRPPFCPCLEEAICLKTSSCTLRRSCSHIPTFSTHHSMIPKLYVMPWRQDMKNQRLLLKVTGKESKIQFKKKGSSPTHCVPVCCRTPLWRPYLWFPSRNPYIFVIGSVSATVKPPPNRPLPHLTRQEKQLITPPTSPGKTHLRPIKLQASANNFNDLLNIFWLDKQS